MLVTMFLSMWINNTATTAMMIPIVDSILLEICMHTSFWFNCPFHHSPSSFIADSVNENSSPDIVLAVLPSDEDPAKKQNEVSNTNAQGDASPASPREATSEPNDLVSLFPNHERVSPKYI